MNLLLYYPYFVSLNIMVGAYSENFEILAVWYQKPGVKIRLTRSNFVTVKPPSEFRFYGKKKKKTGARGKKQKQNKTSLEKKQSSLRAQFSKET